MNSAIKPYSPLLSVVGVQATTKGVGALLTGFLSLLSYTIQAYLPRGGATHGGLDSPVPIHQENSSQANLIRAVLQLRLPFPSDSRLWHLDT